MQKSELETREERGADMLATQQQGRVSSEGERGERRRGAGQQQVAEVISLPYVGTPANIYIDIFNTRAQHIHIYDRVLRNPLQYQVTIVFQILKPALFPSIWTPPCCLTSDHSVCLRVSGLRFDVSWRML